MKQYDVVVVGMGIMGCAVAARLTQAGLNVLSLEQYELGNNRNSSHGQTRLFRLSYFEDSLYVPLLKEALEDWLTINRTSGEEILSLNGLLIAGDLERSQTLQGVLASASEYQLEVDTIKGSDCSQLISGLKVPPSWTGLLDKQAGFLDLDKSLHFFTEVVRSGSGQIMEGTVMELFNEHGGGVEVKTSKGIFSCSHLIVTAGSWLNRIAGGQYPLEVEMNLQYWFKSRGCEDFSGSVPAFAFDTPDGFYYGVPQFGSEGLVKVAKHKTGFLLDELEQLFQDSRRNLSEIQSIIERYLPGVAPELIREEPCLYTNTPDGHFILDSACPKTHKNQMMTVLIKREARS
ncbi:MAG: FAD-dependent oxidoreductase [Endozoicomonas sp.]|uniref:FAD-dependent oxidoreductase n=1 Tax=Endozoicomonas sp. TaxID=1892382 RepID=UPI003D9BE81D